MPADRPPLPTGNARLSTRSFLVTCEHADKRIPPRFHALFAAWEAPLASHRGYDAGALVMARDLAKALDAPLIFSTVSRLLIDLNRSPTHPKLYSEALRQGPPALRRIALTSHYLPYRQRAEHYIASAIAAGRQMIHISSHSFTPVLAGETRNADIGLLYDPSRPDEAALCQRWQATLKLQAPELTVRRNYPYTGKSDGFCAWLRQRYPPQDYVGIELEINQKHVLPRTAAWRRVRGAITAALAKALSA